MIDTLKYTRELESAGLNSEQAEKIVRAQIDMITTSVATKADLKVLEARVDLGFARIYSHFKDIDRKFKDIDRRFELFERRFEDIDRRFEDIDRRFEDIDRRFEDIDRRFEDIGGQLNGVKDKFKELEDRVTFKLTGVMVLLLSLFEAARRFF